MRPSARQIVECVDWTLEHKVAPVVDDKWAASSLRSVHCLLAHLAERVEREGPMLFEDNADCRETLTAVADLAAAAGEADLASRCRDAIGTGEPAPGAYPTISELAAENDRLQETLDVVLRASASAKVRAAVEAQARRRLEREQLLFIPAFLATPF